MTDDISRQRRRAEERRAKKAQGTTRTITTEEDCDGMSLAEGLEANRRKQDGAYIWNGVE